MTFQNNNIELFCFPTKTAYACHKIKCAGNYHISSTSTMIGTATTHTMHNCVVAELKHHALNPIKLARSCKKEMELLNLLTSHQLGTLLINNATTASILLISAGHLHAFTQGPSHTNPYQKAATQQKVTYDTAFHKAPSQFIPSNGSTIHSPT